MDPDVALAELTAAIDAGDVDIAADRLDALDEWIMRGGYLPKAWQDAQRRADDVAAYYALARSL